MINEDLIEEDEHLEHQGLQALGEDQQIYVHNKEDYDLYVLESINAAVRLKGLVRLSDKILKKKRPAFIYSDGMGSDRERSAPCAGAVCTRLGTEIVNTIDLDIAGIYTEFPEHKFHPRLRILMDAIEQGQAHYREFIASPQATQASCVVVEQKRCLIAQEILFRVLRVSRTPEHRGNCERHAHARRQRIRSARKLIDSLFTKRARLLCVRVDLRYSHVLKWLRHDPSTQRPPSYEEVCSHREHLRDIMRKQLFSKVEYGYLMRMEWAPRTGFHFHLMLLLDGRSLRDGIKVGNLVGMAWIERVTKGQGFFFNCNTHALNKGYRWRGTGMFHRDDEAGKLNLLQAAKYLCKADYYMGYYRGEGERTFFRSEIDNDRD